MVRGFTYYWETNLPKKDKKPKFISQIFITLLIHANGGHLVESVQMHYLR